MFISRWTQEKNQQKSQTMSHKLSGCKFTHFKVSGGFLLALKQKIATLEHIKKLSLHFSFQICGFADWDTKKMFGFAG